MKRRRSALRGAVVAALLTVVAPPVASQAPTIRFLDAADDNDTSLAYTITPGTELLLPFAVHTTGRLELYLSPFHGEHGDGISVEPSIVELPHNRASQQRIAFATELAILTLRLKIPPFPTAGKYTGTLAVLQEGKLQQHARIALSRGLVQRPARLVLDQKSVTVHDITGKAGDATFRVQARNASAEWAAVGVFLRVLDVSAPAGNNFDPVRHLRLTWNRSPADGLWYSPTTLSAGWTIAPNEQVEIGGELQDLAPGEYTVRLGLGATNATVDTDQVLTLKVLVKDAIWWPVLLLLTAILISWVATKGLEAQRRRATQLQKVTEIRRAGWMIDPNTMPAVAQRAFLKQAEDHNRSWFNALVGQDTTTAQIRRAELLATLLDRIQRLRDRIDKAGWSAMLRHRATKRLNAIASSMNPEMIDAAAAKDVGDNLGHLEQWFDSQSRDRLYLSDFANDVDGVLGQSNPSDFKSHQELIKQLRDAIETGRAINGAHAKFESAYGMLKVLWEYNRIGDYDTVSNLFQWMDEHQERSLEEFFRKADSLAWMKLKDADFGFVTPDDDSRQAYELIKFEIAPTNRDLGKNFLFKHQMTYEWTFTMTSSSRWLWRRLSGTDTWRECTTEPRVVQYAPRAGTLGVSVALLYNGKPVTNPPKSKEWTIDKSSDYSWLSIFQFADLAALAIAMLFAVVTGLATYYFGKHAFGSLTDYVSLFVWGAGVDQTKNFLQNLAQTSGPAAP